MTRTRTAAVEAPFQPTECPPHHWCIPGPPYIDAEGKPWPQGDIRRDWTCTRCQAHRPDTSTYDEAARLRATWPAAKRAAAGRASAAKAQQRQKNDALYAREAMSTPTEVPMRWTNRP